MVFKRRRGLVLVVILCCLAALALMGVTFSLLASLERTTAGNYRLTVQARLLARAGVETAVSRLSSPQALASAHVDGGDWRYWGNDVAGVDPLLRDVALVTAKRPSYAAASDRGKVDQVRLRGDDQKTFSVGVSGRLKGGDFLDHGNIYSLEVRDLSGCLFVNDGLKMQGGNRSSVSENLRRILNALGRVETINVAGLGDILLANRPPVGGYPSWGRIAALLREKAGAGVETIDRLERCLTVHGWSDPSVVNPVPFSASASRLYPVRYERGELDVYRRGPGKDHRNQLPAVKELGWIEDAGDEASVPGTTAAVYGHDELFPSYVEVVHRAPVNVNTAPEAVLVALIADLRGVFLMEKRTSAPLNYGPDSISYGTSGWLVPDHDLVMSKAANTWEYMGHTYSGEKWHPLDSIDEGKTWSDPTGATTHDPGPPSGSGIADHDELGRLTATVAFGLGGSGKGPSAKAIANEILLCRGGKGDYASLPFGGPFKS